MNDESDEECWDQLTALGVSVQNGLEGNLRRLDQSGLTDDEYDEMNLMKKMGLYHIA